MLNSAREIIEAFGGATVLSQKLARFGRVQPNAVAMWALRGSVPGKWHLALLQLADEEGVDLPLSALMQREGAA